MSAADDTDPTPSSIEEIKADIEQTRAELADTVDQMADKLNVKSQVGKKAQSIKDDVGERAAHVKAAAPAPVQHSLDAVGQKAGPVLKHVDDATAPHRGKIIAGVLAGLVTVVVLRRFRARRSS